MDCAKYAFYKRVRIPTVTLGLQRFCKAQFGTPLSFDTKGAKKSGVTVYALQNRCKPRVTVDIRTRL